MENKSEIFGKRLKSLRDRTGESQEAVASAIGISRPRYSHYENNHVEPDIELIRKLANYYKVTTDYLLGESNDPNLTAKDEKDIAKKMEKIKRDLTDGDGLSFYGEPMSPEAVESLLEAIEYAERQTVRVNKKFIPKKYRENKDKPE